MNFAIQNFITTLQDVYHLFDCVPKSGKKYMTEQRDQNRFQQTRGADKDTSIVVRFMNS